MFSVLIIASVVVIFIGLIWIITALLHLTRKRKTNQLGGKQNQKGILIEVAPRLGSGVSLLLIGLIEPLKYFMISYGIGDNAITMVSRSLMTASACSILLGAIIYRISKSRATQGHRI